MYISNWHLNFSEFHDKFLAEHLECMEQNLLVHFFLAFVCDIDADFVVVSVKKKRSDLVYSLQDIPIQSQDLEEPELMQQPSPNSDAQLNSIMGNV